MATNYEKIQADLAKVNYTLWEPTPIEDVQLSLCRLGCLEQELTKVAADITDVANALNDIENVATSGTETDVSFKIEYGTGNMVWDMRPSLSGVIIFTVNTNSKFFSDYLVPAVSELVVPTTTTDDQGNTVDRPAAEIKRDREHALKSRPTVAVETSIAAINALKQKVSDKKAALEATYSG